MLRGFYEVRKIVPLGDTLRPHTAHDTHVAIWHTRWGGASLLCPRDARPRIRKKGAIVLRLLLVEDHTLFRGTLALMLRLQPDMEVVAECGSVAECRALGGLLGSVDVALLDLLLPDGKGTELVAVLREANPEAKALILSTSIETELAERLPEAGADGVLDKMTPMTAIASEVRRLVGTRGA